MYGILSFLGYPGPGPTRASKALSVRQRRSLTLERLEDRTLPALTITPTFDTSITSDANAAAIENTINSAISFYESAFTNPINVTITFKEGGGFGHSNVTFFPIAYATFRSALAAEPQTADTATALAHLPNQTNNPVNNDANLFLKTATIRALGIPGNFPPIGGFDGVITLNTSLSTPGSPGSTNQFSLFALAQHEIDEVLGLGSALPSLGNANGFPPSNPLPEDLYRYSANGSRTWIVTGDDAFFSLDGTTDLVRFNQGNVNNNNGDYGDWWSNNGSGNAGANPPSRVQDAVNFAGKNPTLATDAGHVELTALNVIGYTLAVSLSPPTLPAGATGSLYNQTITASGGTGTLTLAVTNFSDGGTGLSAPGVSGNAASFNSTPTVAGSASFDLTATDAVGGQAFLHYTITVHAAPSITTTTLANYWTAGASGYSQTIQATGGTGALTFSVSAGTLPAGLSLNASTGGISGTPTTAGNSPFTITVTDSTNATGSKAYTVVVIPSQFTYDQNAHTLVITLTSPFPNFQYTQVTTAIGSAYTFVLSDHPVPTNTVAQTFPDAALTTAPASGATVTVNGQGAAGQAILIFNNTYIDAGGMTQETPERISLGSQNDAGVGAVAKFVGNSISNASYNFLSLKNFPISYAYVGRNDATVNLFGTAGVPYNGFVSAGNYSYIGGPGLFHLAQGASSVYGYSAGQASDFAYHYSANPASAFVVSGVAFSYMSTSDTVNGVTQSYFNVGAGFTQNTGVSKNPGQDFAYIIDSPATDTFVGGTAYSYMYSTGAGGNFTEFDAAYAFALVFGQSFVGGTDTAVNNDPNKNILVGFHLQ